MKPIVRSLVLTAIGAGLIAVSGCAGRVTPYQPVSSANTVSGGFSEERIGEDRFRVRFAGNALTSRERVEAYLLFRAAELTTQEGFDWFVIEDRVIEHDVERQARPDPLYDPWFEPRFGYWRPYWRYYGPYGWRDWYPYYGHSFWTDHIDVRKVERFEAIAEIRMGDGPPPNHNLRVFIAKDVINQIGPRVEYPGDK